MKIHWRQSPDFPEPHSCSQTAIFGVDALLVCPNKSIRQIFDIGFYLRELGADFLPGGGSDFPLKTLTNSLRDSLGICLRFQRNGSQRPGYGLTFGIFFIRASEYDLFMSQDHRGAILSR